MSREKEDKLVQPVYRMEEQVESAYAAAFFGRSRQEKVVAGGKARVLLSHIAFHL